MAARSRDGPRVLGFDRRFLSVSSSAPCSWSRRVARSRRSPGSSSVSASSFLSSVSASGLFLGAHGGVRWSDSALNGRDLESPGRSLALSLGDAVLAASVRNARRRSRRSRAVTPRVSSGSFARRSRELDLASRVGARLRTLRRASVIADRQSRARSCSKARRGRWRSKRPWSSGRTRRGTPYPMRSQRARRRAMSRHWRGREVGPSSSSSRAAPRRSSARPRSGVTLADKKAVTRAMLRSGAPIQSLNVVRKHLSRIKGGGLAHAARHRRIVTLIASDVIGGHAGRTSDPVPPSSILPLAPMRAPSSCDGPRASSGLPLVESRGGSTAHILASPEELARRVAKKAGGSKLLRPSQASVEALAAQYVALAAAHAERLRHRAGGRAVSCRRGRWNGSGRAQHAPRHVGRAQPSAGHEVLRLGD